MRWRSAEWFSVCAGKEGRIVRLEHIVKHVRGRVLLDDITLEIETGALVTLTGPSGSGKTTLLRLIAGLEAPEKGELIIDGRIATRGNRILIAPFDRGIGMVFQDFALWPHLTVEQNIRYGLRYRMAKNTDAEQCLDSVVESFELREVRKRYPARLSGGERQRVALARALAPRPPILLLDEPVSSLDGNRRKAALEAVERLRLSAKCTVILVSHSIHELEMPAARRLVLEQGRLINE